MRAIELEVEGPRMARRSHLMMEPSLLAVYSQLPSSDATAAVTGPRCPLDGVWCTEVEERGSATWTA